jgi:hypothetical protein
MVKLSEIDMDAGCDENGVVIVDDDGIDEVAAYFAAMSNKSNDNEWWPQAEQIAENAVYTALSNPDLIAKLYKQICA